MIQRRKRNPWPLITIIVLGLLLIAVATYTLRPSNRTPAPAEMGKAQQEQRVKDHATTNVTESVLVLNYHKIDMIFNSLAVNPNDFRWQMQYLVDHGYTTITPDELLDGLEGKKKLPKTPVLITFDDGYEDNYQNAYPVLKQMGLKATIFVVTDFMNGKKGYLTWAQCREMEKHGITVESHTVDHKSMTDLSDDQLRKELTDSKAAAEKELGHPVSYIAYPTGAYNLHIADLAKDAGYRAAFTIKYGNVDGASNVYAIERVPIFHTAHTNRDFVERINYTPIFQQFGWVKH